MFVVYSMVSEYGEILYIGVTGRGLARFSEHQRYSSWFVESATIKLEHFESLKEARRREEALIREHKPKGNKDFTRHGVDYASSSRRTTGKAFSSNESSGVRNVSFHKASNSWSVQINRFGKTYRGGYYRNLEDAEAAAKELRKQLFGQDVIESGDNH